MNEVINLLLGPLGLTVALLVVLFAGYKGWWVWGKDYARMEKEKDEWKEAALRGTRVAERAVTIHEAAKEPNETL